jgi:hypothetical protein
MLAGLLMKRWTAFSGGMLSQRAISPPAVPRSSSEVGDFKRTMVLARSYDKECGGASRHTMFLAPELAFNWGLLGTRFSGRAVDMESTQLNRRGTFPPEAQLPRAMKYPVLVQIRI